MKKRDPDEKFFWTIGGAFFITSAAAVLVLSVVGLVFNAHTLESFGFRIGLFLFSVLCLLVSAYLLTKKTLYPMKVDAAFEIFGGFRVEHRLNAISGGNGATWPFAKLSVSKERIFLQTPWGNFNWDRDSVRPIQSIGVFPGIWKISDDDSNSPAVIFISMPWQAGQVRRKLENLGYHIL